MSAEHIESCLKPTVINKYKASGYTVYLQVNSILRIMLHLQMLYSQLEDQQLIGANLSDHTNTILPCSVDKCMNLSELSGEVALILENPEICPVGLKQGVGI